MWLARVNDYKCLKMLVEILKGREHLGNLGVSTRIILKGT
jgi:hypothetical protein